MTHRTIALGLVVASLGAGCGDDGDGSGGASSSSSSAATTGSSSSSSGSGSTSSTSASGSTTSASSSSGGSSMMNFFITSDTFPNGNFGGLAGADQRCQTLAAAVGAGDKTWVAYLSNFDPPVDARDRIGPGPYYNAAGVMVAADDIELHAMNGNADLFLTETGEKVNGQWEGSPSPNQHDIMTGSNPAGALDFEGTCEDWTSDQGNVKVGHSDGLGPNMNPDPPFGSWNSSHDGSCGDPGSTGGAAKIYCFAAP